MNRKLTAALGAGLMASAAMLASACSRTDPCATLAAPTAEDLALSNSGREVEQTILAEGAFGVQVEVECELENGRWTYDPEEA